MYNWDGGSPFKDKAWSEHLPTDAAVSIPICELDAFDFLR